jgi:regulator of protease activity HflC (stomatin/prohibitin superfamily)
MRAKLGAMMMDQAFREREEINASILSAMSLATSAWGAQVLRFEVTSLEPSDSAVLHSLHKQATAERDKREAIKNAEADKARIELAAQA